MKLKEIVVLIKGRFIQNIPVDGEAEVTGINSLEEATENEISFFYDLRYSDKLKTSRSLNIVVPDDKTYLDLCFQSKKNVVVVENVKKSITKIAALFCTKTATEWSISSFANISANAQIDREVFIAPFVFIGNNVYIGKHTKIFPFTYIGDNCKIGNNCIIDPNVTIYSNVEIGNNVVIHSGCVIGVDGFGFFRDESGKNEKIPHLGKVIIEDDVEIFANCSIAKATFGKTIIKKGVKIDSLVHIAHNVKVMENTLIAAQTGISGNCVIGKNVILAGQVGVIDHITIGDNAIITAQSGIAKDVPADSIYSGAPAIPHSIWKRVSVLLPKLPELLKLKDNNKEHI